MSVRSLRGGSRCGTDRACHVSQKHHTVLRVGFGGCGHANDDGSRDIDALAHFRTVTGRTSLAVSQPCICQYSKQ